MNKKEEQFEQETGLNRLDEQAYIEWLEERDEKRELILKDKKNERSKLYELGLHDVMSIRNGVSVMRVAGGWLYSYWDFKNDVPLNTTFIPFNNEFQSESHDRPEEN